MSLGVVGKKCGMTRIPNDNGEFIPVTVIEVVPNRVTQLKTVEKDGYTAIQVTSGQKKVSHLTKAIAGVYAKAQVEAGDAIREFRVCAETMATYKLGDILTVDLFKVDQKVDVQARSIGKGFAGCIKAHHFKSQRASHGNSLSHRVPGSTGQNQTPGKVIKGKRMPKHLGDVTRTMQSLAVVRVDVEKGLLLVKGCVPGAPGARVIVTPAIKHKGE